MKQGTLFGRGEEIVGFTIRRFLHRVDAHIAPEDPFEEIRQRVAEGTGRALSVSVLGIKAGRRIGRRYKEHMPELKEELSERVAKFPEGLTGRLGELCLFGAIGPEEKGKKYLGYLVEGEARDALRAEQGEILEAFDLPGREIETPHLTIYSSLAMDEIIQECDRYRRITPEGVIPIVFGEPRVVELNQSR